MQVGVPDHGLPVRARPARGAGVEVDAARPEIGPLDRVEEIRVRLELAAQAGPIREVRVRRDDQAAVARLEPRDVVHRAHRLGRAGREIEEEHVPSGDGALDAGDEGDAAFTRQGGHTGIRELAVVQRDGERVEAELGRAIHQVARTVENPVERVLAGVEMQVYFEHVRLLSEGLRPSDSPTRALGRRFAGSLPPPRKLRWTRRSAFGAKAGRARGSLAMLARAWPTHGAGSSKSGYQRGSRRPPLPPPPPPP